jgi:hypothetical protein
MIKSAGLRNKSIIRVKISAIPGTLSAFLSGFERIIFFGLP